MLEWGRLQSGMTRILPSEKSGFTTLPPGERALRRSGAEHPQRYVTDVAQTVWIGGLLVICPLIMS